MKPKKLFLYALLLILVFSLLKITTGRAVGLARADLSSRRAYSLLDELSPEERIGQLFLVTFLGSTADENSQIYNLIANYHIGGVVLQASNDNFLSEPDTINAAYQLISQLQTIEMQASQNPISDRTTSGKNDSHYIPLFIGISQNGDGYPNDQILSGLTPLPSQMSLGATWDTSLTQQVGSIVGKELSALGFNLYFGPSLDVLESPEISSGNGLGTAVFGGDPFWVGAMGQAYINGLHSGSENRMIVIAKHFPGGGSSDRPFGEEPATVRKSLEQLKQIELAPFFNVTGNTPLSQSAADGLLVSQIRYQGFQGNIRDITPPVSFDSQALSQIMALPNLLTWRQNGGLIVSDDLGSKTVRRFYDPAGQSFSARLVATSAFLAGNDLLYLGNIVSSDAPDSYTSVIRTLDFFTQKYYEDSAFAQRVDNAAARILDAKYRIYNNYSLDLVIPPEQGLDDIGQSTSVIFDVASSSLTLISPEPIVLATVLPTPPEIGDHLLFITDIGIERQCSTCLEDHILAVDALQNAVLRLYGPQGSGQITSSRMVSYALEDLPKILEGGEGYPSLESNLRQTDWVIISILDADLDHPQLSFLTRFLSERQDLLRNKKVIVFALGAPYYLDSTDISKLTAYYGLYSKTWPFIDVVARSLFHELTPAGYSPVSIPGIGYDLLSITSPDAEQVIDLYIDVPSAPTPVNVTTATTPEPTIMPNFRVGDTLSIRTGPILDHNQNPVPDGTGVRFTLSLSGGEGGVIKEAVVTTTNGIARTSFSIERSGLLEIRASSEPATTSVVLQLDISSEGEGSGIIFITPTRNPGLTIVPAVPISDMNEQTTFSRGVPGFSGWLIMLIVIGGSCYFVYRLGLKYYSHLWGLRWAACTLLGGLLTYNYLALGLPGSEGWIKSYGFLGIVAVIIIGTITGMGASLIWLWAIKKLKRRSS